MQKYCSLILLPLSVFSILQWQDSLGTLFKTSLVPTSYNLNIKLLVSLWQHFVDPLSGDFFNR